MFPARSRTWRLSPKKRLSPTVKAVSSEPKEKVADVVIDSEQGPSSSFSFLIQKVAFFKRIRFLLQE